MRKLFGVAAIVAVVVATVAYVVVSAEPSGTVDLAVPDSLLYVDNGRVGRAPLGDPGVGGPGGMSCLRVFAAGGAAVCLRAVAVPPSFEAVVYAGNDVEKTIPLDGTPSRARVSPSGRLVGWTVFREGDSYLPAGYFSTTAGIYDRASGTLYGSMEDFTVQGIDSHDRNFWGITFTPDDKGFYATLATGGTTWLVKGDLASRTMVPVRENAECPSLSPDGGRVVYKKRVGDRWRLHLLDLGTGQERPLGDTADVDDQAAWLDDRTILYSRPGPDGHPAIHSLSTDPSATPRLIRANATSPVVTVRSDHSTEG